MSDPGAELAGAEGVASAGTLRRVRLLAAGYVIAAAVAFGAAAGWRRGVALTASGALSIVALRSLEGVVRRLRVGDETGGSLGLFYPLRLLLLTVLVVGVALRWRDPLALVLGLSAVPLALMLEAGLLLLGVGRAGEGES